MSVIDTASLNGHGYAAFPVVIPGGGPASALPAGRVVRTTPPLTSEAISGGKGYYGPGNVPLALPPSVDDVTRVGTFGHYEWMMTNPVVSASVRALKLAILAGGMDLKATISAKPGLEGAQAGRADGEGHGRFLLEGRREGRGLEFAPDGPARCSWCGYKLAEKVFALAEGGKDAGKLLWVRIKPKPRDAFRLVVDPAHQRARGGVSIRGGQDPRRTPAPREGRPPLLGPGRRRPAGTSVLRPAVEPANLKRLMWPELYAHSLPFGSAGLVGKTSPREPSHPAVDVDGNVLPGAPAMGRQQRLLAALQAYQNGACMVHASGGKVYTIPPQGAGEVFHSAVDLFNREIVHGILYQTRATTEAQHGSKADSQTGQDIFGLRVRRGPADAGGDLEGGLLPAPDHAQFRRGCGGRVHADRDVRDEKKKISPRSGARGQHGLSTRPEPTGRGRLDAGTPDPRRGRRRGQGETKGAGHAGVEGVAAGAGWPGSSRKEQVRPAPLRGREGGSRVTTPDTVTCPDCLGTGKDPLGERPWTKYDGDACISAPDMARSRPSLPRW